MTDTSNHKPWFKIKWGDAAENMPPAPPQPEDLPAEEGDPSCIEEEIPKLPTNQPEDANDNPDQPRGTTVVDYKI